MLGAQQAASAHYIGHVASTGTAALPAAAGENGDEQVPGCMGCAAFAGLTAAPPVVVSPLALAEAAATALAAIPSAYRPAPSALPYAARAPPALL